MTKQIYLSIVMAAVTVPAVNAAADYGPQDIITDPKGEVQLYTKATAGTFVLQSQIEMYMDEFPSYVVWGDDNSVYFKDIISTAASDTYVKGTIEGDLITIPCGQLVAYVEAEGDYPAYGVAVGVAKTMITGNYYNFYVDTSVEEVVMKVNDDGTMELVLPGEPFDGEHPTDYVLCLYDTYEYEFFGFSDFYQFYTPEDYTPITMPGGYEPEQYVYIDDFDYASLVSVVNTGEYLYIQGLNPMMTDSVVRAEIRGNEAYIPQDQYQGIYMDMMYIFTKIYLDNPDYNPLFPDRDPYIRAESDVEFKLTIDDETGVIRADTPGVYLSFQPDEDGYENAQFFLAEFILKYQEEKPASPALPTHLNWKTDLAYAFGYNDFQFNISNYSEEGNLLNATYLFYKVYVNGEPLIFGERLVTDLNGQTATAYEGVPGEQYWLPYDFSNFEDIYKLSISEFDIGIYEPEVETVGVQAMYLYDNQPYYSDVVTLNVETGETQITDGIEKIEVTPEVSKVEYYNLQGVKVTNPRHGIFVKRTTYTDGTVKSVKSLLR